MLKTQLKTKDKTFKSSASKNVSVVPLPKSKYKINIFTRDIKYLKIKDVRRAYSRLIQDYCKGLVNNEDAKTITYMFSGYLQLVRDIEFEERIKILEERVGDER